MKKIIGLSLALFLTSPSFAFGISNAPQGCPKISGLKAGGVNDAISVNPGSNSWFAINLNNKFGTPDEWTFVIYIPKAKDKENAIKQANGLINSLSFLSGPEKEDKNMWSCSYINEAKGVAAFTFNPPVPALPQSMLNHFFHK